MKRHTEPAVIMDMAIRQMGSVGALANALQVDETTVRRWRSGHSGLQGTALVAVMQIIKHPEEFSRYRK